MAIGTETHVTDALIHRVRSRAQQAGNERRAARSVISALLDAGIDANCVSREDVKFLILEAVRAFRAGGSAAV